MSKPPPNVKKEWHLARQLCIYGDGDGRPIGSPERLAELTGLTVGTIRRHIDVWLKEREEIVAGATTSGLALKLSADEIESQQADLLLLRTSINRVSWEIKQHDKIVSRLEKICENFSLNTEVGDQALSLFDAYLRASSNRQALEKHFLALQARWTKLVGVDALQDVALTKAKSDATLASKLDARKAEAAEGVRDVTPAGLGVFRRGGA